MDLITPNRLKMGRNNGFDSTLCFLLQPANQFCGTRIIGGGIKNNSFIFVEYNHAVARDFTKAVGVQVAGMYITVF